MATVISIDEIKATHLARAQAKLPVLEDFDWAAMAERTLAAGNVMWCALGVIARSPRIAAWLEANDRQALGQALAAMQLWADEHPALDLPGAHPVPNDGGGDGEPF